MNQQSESQGRRLDGWKAIAAYFKRDRSTVTRWARERQLPVHRIPGGKQGSVFAYEGELALWAKQLPSGVLDGTPASANDSTPTRPSFWRKPKALVVAIGALLLVAISGTAVYALLDNNGTDRQHAVPRDPQAAADYVSARDAWARRTRDDIAHSIQLYESVIHREPDFAPARAALAEAWLIYREYGEVSDAKAYAVARVAAQKALELDPDLASGHRASGFIAYWWDNDPQTAVSEFKRAIQLDDRDAQTHFWYANVLADLGEDRAAETQYRRARLLNPGSQPIAVEYACAQWQAGRDDLALKMMTDLERRYPSDATINNCLTWIYISRGDMANYAREYRLMAGHRNEPDIQRLSKLLDKAVAKDPKTAHRVLIQDARREIAIGTRRIRETPAFYASAMGDRPELLELLKEANVLGERWYSPSITTRIHQRWKNDPQILALLKAVWAPRPRIDGL